MSLHMQKNQKSELKDSYYIEKITYQQGLDPQFFASGPDGFSYVYYITFSHQYPKNKYHATASELRRVFQYLC